VTDDKKVLEGVKGKFPLQTVAQIEAHTREAKEQMKKGATEFMLKFEARAEEERLQKETEDLQRLKEKMKSMTP